MSVRRPVSFKILSPGKNPPGGRKTPQYIVSPIVLMSLPLCRIRPDLYVAVAKRNGILPTERGRYVMILHADTVAAVNDDSVYMDSMRPHRPITPTVLEF